MKRKWSLLTACALFVSILAASPVVGAPTDDVLVPIEVPNGDFEQSTAVDILEHNYTEKIPGWEVEYRAYVNSKETKPAPGEKLFHQIINGGAGNNSNVAHIYDNCDTNANLGDYRYGQIILATEYLDLPAIGQSAAVDYQVNFDYIAPDYDKSGGKDLYVKGAARFWAGVIFYNDSNQYYRDQTNAWTALPSASATHPLNAQWNDGARVMYQTNAADGYVQIKSGEWGSVNLPKTAPAGATKAKIFFVAGGNPKYDFAVDNVQLLYSPKLSAKVTNHEFETGNVIPGWSPYFNTAFDAKQYYTLSNDKAADGSSALAIYKDIDNGGVYIYSDPILIPEGDKTGKSFKVSFDGRSEGGKKRGRYVLQFYQNGPDGIPGTADDKVLTNKETGGSTGIASAEYNAATGELTGGQYLGVSDKYALSGTDNYRFAYQELTNDWKTYNYSVKYASDAGAYDYVRMSFYQVVNQGGTAAYFDNLMIQYGDDASGFTPLAIRNADFEEPMQVAGWSVCNGVDPDTDLNVMVTSDNVLSGHASLTLIDKDPGRRISVWSDPIDVMPNVNYNLRFAYNAGAKLSCDLKFFDTKGQVYSAEEGRFIPANETMLVGKDETNAAGAGTTGKADKAFTSPQGAAYARVILSTTDADTATCYFDNVQVSYSIPGGLAVSQPYLTCGGAAVTDMSMVSEGDTVQANASFYNNTDEDQEFRLILVKYDAEGIVERIVSKTVAVAKRDEATKLNETVSANVSLEVPSEGGKINIFVWDSFTGMNNMVSPTSITN